MKMNKWLKTLLLFFTFPMLLSAQDKFGQVSDEDLLMTTYELDTSAAAVVLYDFGFVAVEISGSRYVQRFRRHRKIKILKEAGLEEGDINLSYYSKDNYQRIGKIKAMVHQPDGTTTELKKDDFFIEKINDNYSRKVFSFPGLQVGSILEYRYDMTSEGITELESWYFQGEIPVRYSELNISIPTEKFNYAYLFQGDAIQVKPNAPIDPSLADKTTLAIEEQKSYVMRNVPAITDEAYITTLTDYMSRIRFQLNYSRSYDGVVEPFLTTWKKLAEKIKNLESIGLEYNRKKNYKKIYDGTRHVIKGIIDPKEKVQAFYDYLSTELTFDEDGRHSVFTDEKLNDSFEKKVYTRSCEANYMLLALLREEEIECHPLWVSLRWHGRMVELYPIVDQFNHAMVLIKINEEFIIADVGSQYRPLNYPRTSALNKMGWMANEDNPVWIDIKPNAGRDVLFCTTALDEEGTLTGNIAGKYTGYNAVPERRHYAEDKDETEHWVNRLEEKYTDVSVTSATYENLEDINEPFKDKVELEIEGAAQQAGDFLYFSPIIYSGFSENIFKQKKRIFPVDIPYPLKEKYVMMLSYPEGYAVEELPEALNLALPNKGGKFLFQVQDVGNNTLQIICDFEINQLFFKPEEYPNIKEFFDLMIEKKGEQVILKKKS